jgi:hypothetical protein
MSTMQIVYDRTTYCYTQLDMIKNMLTSHQHRFCRKRLDTADVAYITKVSTMLADLETLLTQQGVCPTIPAV